MKRTLSLLLAAFVLALPAAAATLDTLTLVTKSERWSTVVPSGIRVEYTFNGVVPALSSTPAAAAYDQWITEACRQLLSGPATDGTSLLTGLDRQLLAIGLRQRPSKSRVASPLSLDVDVRRVYETSRIITMKASLVYYASVGERCEVVRERSLPKTSAAGVTWDNLVKSKSAARLHQQAAEAVRSFFGVSDWTNLKSRLTGGDAISPSAFPLPKQGPAFENYGIRLCYDAGEIAPASYGRPTALIPYSKISSLFTQSAKQLLR